MSENKKVWIGNIRYEYVNGFKGGLSFPNVYDYPAHERIVAEIVSKRNLEEYKDSQQLEELRKKIKSYMLLIWNYWKL